MSCILSVDDDPFLLWSEPGIGRYLFMMTAVGIISFAILLIKEYELVNKVSQPLTCRLLRYSNEQLIFDYVCLWDTR